MQKEYSPSLLDGKIKSYSLENILFGARANLRFVTIPLKLPFSTIKDSSDFGDVAY